MESYYDRNKAKARRYAKEYYWKNRAKLLQKRKANNEIDPEKARKTQEYQRAYYEQNKSQILEKRAELKRKRALK